MELSLVKVFMFFALFLSVTNCYKDDEQEDTVRPQTVPLQTNLDKIVKSVSGAWEDFSKGFSSSMNSIKDLLGDNKDDLLQNVNETRKILGKAARNLTKDTFKPTLDTLNEWFREVTSFQQKVLNNTGSNLKNLTKDWTKKMTDHWNEGLQNIINITRNMKISDEERKRNK